jgi:hypothetical protein
VKAALGNPWQRLQSLCEAQGWVVRIDPVGDGWLNLVVRGPLPIAIGCSDADDVERAAKALLEALDALEGEQAPLDLVEPEHLVAGQCGSCGAEFVCESRSNDRVELCPNCANAECRRLATSATAAAQALEGPLEALASVRVGLGRRAPSGARPELRRAEEELRRISRRLGARDA